MIFFKACVRCEGDIHVKDDQYLNCLECGAVTEVPTRIDIKALAEIA
jgi:hypothetical protein